MSFKTYLLIFLTLLLIAAGKIQNVNAEDSYRIGAEDVLFISVWGNEQLTREVLVRPDGKISFPLVDDLPVAGLTCMEVKELITKKLTPYIQVMYQVTVILQSINSYKVYVMGAVKSPGAVTLRRKTTLLHLLAMVGGDQFSENADFGKSYVLRDGKQLPVAFEKLIEKGDVKQDIELLPNDFIYIHDNFDKRISIIGEVAIPKTMTFKDGMTILDALLIAGGPTQSAHLNGTRVVRRGKEDVSIDVRLKDLLKKGKLEYNLKLQPKDLIIVPASFL
ncbi:MAG: polysaccharide biosynthesis/export family protein [bacterium]